MTTAPTSLVSVRGLAKCYAAPVLSDIDLDLAAGEVHALVGANGAGKSTLGRILSGLVMPDGGRMTLAGRAYAPRNKHDAEAAGVHIVQQELNLIGTLDVAENLFLNRLPSRLGFVRYGRIYAEAERVLATVGLEDVNPRTPVDQLGVGRQQLVEIAAALLRNLRVLVLDEPTAALTDPQVELLFTHVRRLQEAGVAILYVSHRLEEIRRIADRTTVLRDGRLITTRPAAELGVDEMVSLMVGREVVAEARPAARTFGPVALKVERLSRGSVLRDVSLSVRRGEILGIAGLVGSGRTELVRAIFGADLAERGTVHLGGRARRPFRRPRAAVRAGLAMVPEDRKQDGLLLDKSIRVNTTLAVARRLARAASWISPRRERAQAEESSDRVALVRHSIEQPVVELSGGNQQKVVIARWLLTEADVFLFDEPTRGIDVGAKATVYRLLADLAERGKALVVVSSELVELMALCDRIAVMSAGRLVADFVRGAWSEDAIMAAAISGYLKREAQA